MKKLIEVALPLDAINAESAREKSIRHGHPSTLHLWWARRPLAACRAVLFAQLVDDPSSHPDRFPTEAAQKAERERLHRLIERLVVWENVRDEKLLAASNFSSRTFSHTTSRSINLCSRSRSAFCAASVGKRSGCDEGSSTSWANSTARHAASGR